MNEHAADKDSIAVWISRTLKTRVRKLAKHRKMTLSGFLEWVLTRETKDVELNEDDHKAIAQEVTQAELRRTDQRKKSK